MPREIRFPKTSKTKYKITDYVTHQVCQLIFSPDSNDIDWANDTKYCEGFLQTEIDEKGMSYFQINIRLAVPQTKGV